MKFGAQRCDLAIIPSYWAHEDHLELLPLSVGSFNNCWKGRRPFLWIQVDPPGELLLLSVHCTYQEMTISRHRRTHLRCCR